MAIAVTVNSLCCSHTKPHSTRDHTTHHTTPVAELHMIQEERVLGHQKFQLKNENCNPSKRTLLGSNSQHCTALQCC